MTPQEMTDRFRPYLFTGERVLWTGQPKQGLVLVGRDALLIPFSLLWGGFAIFWNANVWALPIHGSPTSLFFRLWGLPFLVAGLYLIFGRFIHDATIRKTVFYAVTNQRVLVLRGSRSPKMTSLDIDRLPRLELSEHRDGSGTIALEANPIFGNGAMNGFGLWTPALSGSTQFFRVAKPRQVLEHSRAVAVEIVNADVIDARFRASLHRSFRYRGLHIPKLSTLRA